MTPTASLQELLLRDADRCVMCGLCLPHCPTFDLTRNEAESPRGRIALAQALARGQLAPGPQLAKRLEHCLGCRACEAMCPSEVRYGRIIGRAKRLLRQSRPAPAFARATATVTGSAVFRPLAALARLAFPGHSPVASLAHALPPQLPTPAPGLHPSRGEQRGRVALFVGCTGESLDAEAVSAATALLQWFGFDVAIAEHNACCGAMHHDLGNQMRLETRARDVVKTYAGETTLISIASGCAGMLRSYDDWLAPSETANLPQVFEITEFLAQQTWPEELHVKPLAKTVAVHVPCSQRHVLKRPDSVLRLLARIPGVTILPLADNRCCGAAGLHMVTQPTTAVALRESKLDELLASGAHYLVSTNGGCALHLRAGARERGMEVELLHPISLLWRQIQGK